MPAGIDGRRRSSRRQFPSDPGDGTGGDSGDLFGPFRGVLDRFRFQFVETHGVGLDKGRVIEVLSDDHVHQRQEESAVGAGPQGDPLAGPGGHLAKPGVKGHHLGPVLLGSGELLYVGVLDPAEIVPAGGDQVLDVGVVNTGQIAVGRVVGDRAAAVAGRGMAGMVRRAEGRHEVLLVGSDGLRMGSPDQGLRPVFCLQLLQLRGDFLKGLFPGDRFEPALAHPFQRLLQPIRVIKGLQTGVSPGTQPAIAQRMLGMAVDLHRPAVLDRDRDAALDAAHLAQRRHHSGRSTGLGDLPLVKPWQTTLQGDQGSCPRRDL